MGDIEQLDEVVANLRKVDACGVAIAQDALPQVLAAAQKTAAAGTTPDGDAWAPKKDGTRALANAASAISAVVSGTTKAVITLILRGGYVYHHTAKGKARRQILPTPDAVPESITRSIDESTKRVVTRLMGGR